MEAQTILRIKPALTQDLHEFDDCMGRVTNRRHTALVGPPPRRRSGVLLERTWYGYRRWLPRRVG